jgi:class 3 adenylate cyclase
MKVLVFTGSPAAFRRIASMRNKKTLPLEILPLASLRSSLPDKGVGAILYIDVRGLSERERSRALAAISDYPRLRFGVIDPAGAVKDVAALFHAGAVDYLGKGIPATVLTARRLSVITAYAPDDDVQSPDQEENPGQDEQSTRTEAGDWSGIAAGGEYRFAFLFIEADDAEELKKRHEPENLSIAMETFRAYVDGIVSQHGGRLWMWSRFGGLALFPLHAATCPAALCALRIMLSRVFYDAEESLLPGPLSFRMALSVGTTVYHENDTGGIVSDAINSIFHLGRRFTRSGQFFMTEEAAALVPDPLREYCVPQGTFEGRRIQRMLRPLSMNGERESRQPCET